MTLGSPTSPATRGRDARSARVRGIESSFAGLGLPLGRLRRQESIRVSLADFEAIHARIAELSALVSQGALVADALPHEGWGVPAGYRAPAEPAPLTPEQPDGTIPCGESICTAWAEPYGENLWRCTSGHLTIHETPEVPEP